MNAGKHDVFVMCVCVCVCQGAAVYPQRDGERRRSTASISSVKYDCSNETGEEGSVEWNGVG